MSEEYGIDHVVIHPKAIKTNDFKEFLIALSNKHRKCPLAILMDQLAVHKGPEVRELCSSLNIVPIFNVPYHPETNPIESAFSKVKAIFNR